MRMVGRKSGVTINTSSAVFASRQGFRLLLLTWYLVVTNASFPSTQSVTNITNTRCTANWTLKNQPNSAELEGNKARKPIQELPKVFVVDTVESRLLRILRSEEMNIHEPHCPRCDVLLGNHISTLPAVIEENDLSADSIELNTVEKTLDKSSLSYSMHMDQQKKFPARSRRRRFSSSDTELSRENPVERTEEKANTHAIEKFLSLCLQQFQLYSQISENTAGQNFTKINNYSLNYKENYGDSNNASQTPINLLTSDTNRVCRYCTRQTKTGFQGFYHHLEVCPKFPLDCPNKCGATDLTRDQLSTHIMEDCREATESCAYRHIGCSFQGSNTNLTNHLDKNIDDHLQLACETIEDQKTELERQADRLRLQDEAIVQLNDTVVRIKTLFDEQVNMLEKQAKLIEKLTEQSKEQKKNYSKLERDMKQKLAELDKSGFDLDNHDDFSRYPGLNGYGEKVWKISNFTKRLSRTRSGRSDDPVCSEPFFTSAFGYKIACWAYLNGRGKELGQSMSLYACVMCGEYDGVLKWPIKPRYTFMLLDQNPDVEKRREVVRVRKVHDFKRDDVRRKGIDRPTRDERAIIVGFDDFVSLEELESGSYLDDESIFIRILVDIPDNN